MSTPVCKVCEQSSSDILDFILCRGNCRRYLHYSCACISEDRFRSMSNKLKRKWKCKDCRVQKGLNSLKTGNLNLENDPSYSLSSGIGSVADNDSGHSLTSGIGSVADNDSGHSLTSGIGSVADNDSGHSMTSGIGSVADNDSGHSMTSGIRSVADNGSGHSLTSDIGSVADNGSGHSLTSGIGSVADNDSGHSLTSGIGSVADNDFGHSLTSGIESVADNDSGHSLSSGIESVANNDSLCSDIGCVIDGLVNQNCSLPNTEQVLNALRQELTQTMNSLEELHTAYNEIALKVTDFEQQMRNQEEILNRISVGVRDRNRSVHILGQNAKDRLEIHGLILGLIITNNYQEFEDEIKNKVVDVGRCFGVIFSVNDIDRVYILKSRKNFEQPVLLVHFFSEVVRDMLIAVRKKKVTNADLQGGSGEKRIYINEHLNPYYKSLWYQTREVANRKGFRYVWFSGGKLYVRKNKHSEKIRITCKEDLKRLNAG